MKLLDAIHAFEEKTGRRSTPKDLPVVLKMFTVEEDPLDLNEALIRMLASFEQQPQGDTPSEPRNHALDQRYAEVKQELGIEDDDDEYGFPTDQSLDDHTRIISIIVKRYPEIFDLNSPRDRLILEVAADASEYLDPEPEA